MLAGDQGRRSREPPFLAQHALASDLVVDVVEQRLQLVPGERTLGRVGFGVGNARRAVGGVVDDLDRVRAESLLAQLRPSRWSGPATGRTARGGPPPPTTARSSCGISLHLFDIYVGQLPLRCPVLTAVLRYPPRFPGIDAPTCHRGAGSVTSATATTGALAPSSRAPPAGPGLSRRSREVLTAPGRVAPANPPGSRSDVASASATTR